ncbi:MULTISPECIES: sugar transferase [unclassified Cytobacillus]|uniref:sugar transferase n=1 Tax=unclassified Cytobacillus TaxID=2675268 RepID=UPI0020422EBA|nr:sugar transferase [Cytobacillus sp. AMY 15.2]MCM3094452.1 sugar transferase [Cytobacillus sp. AMY 15.2]
MILAILDIVLVYLGYIATIWFYHVFSIPAELEITLNLLWLLVPSATAFIFFYFFDLYKNLRGSSLKKQIYSRILPIVIFSIFVSAVSFSGSFMFYRKSFFIEALIIQIILLSAIHGGIWLMANKLHGRKRVVIICEDEKTGQSLAQKFNNHKWFEISGYLPINQIPHLENHIDKFDVFLLAPAVIGQLKSDILNLCIKNEKEVLIVPHVSDLFIHSAKSQQIGDMLVISINAPGLKIWQRIIKRCFDVFACIILLVLTSPIFIALLIIIPLTSSGPAIYKQERIGLNGKPYWIYKFRSMIQDAEKISGPVLAENNDARITAIGRFIRAIRLDELPQLLNVLKGEMSLIGPRPEREFFISQYKEKLPYYSYRLSVKPGITGLAQVLAYYSTTAEDKLRFDLLYVRNYSFSLDMKILFQTLQVVLQRDRARGLVKNSDYGHQSLIESLEQDRVI